MGCYTYWKANYILHTLAFKREFHAIIHPFRKIIIHTWQGISCPLYLHIYLHTIEKHFPRYLGAKYQSWGRTISSKKLSQASPNFHSLLLLQTSPPPLSLALEIPTPWRLILYLSIAWWFVIGLVSSSPHSSFYIFVPFFSLFLPFGWHIAFWCRNSHGYCFGCFYGW